MLGHGKGAKKKHGVNKRGKKLFNLASFKKLAKQSNTVHTYMLNLAEEYVELKNAIINPRVGIALLKKGVSYARLTKRNGMAKRDLHDISRVYCTISSAKKMIANFFANSTVNKLIVNVANERHSTALFVERTNNSYTFTSFNPNHKEVIKMTQNVCKAINLKRSATRTVRCVSGKKNNYYEQCFSLTWRVIHETFVGLKNVDGYPYQFCFDFVKGKKLNTQQ